MAEADRTRAAAELQALAREKAAEAIAMWRAEGQSEAQIEKKLRRPLPPELRRATTS